MFAIRSLYPKSYWPRVSRDVCCDRVQTTTRRTSWPGTIRGLTAELCFLQRCDGVCRAGIRAQRRSVDHQFELRARWTRTSICGCRTSILSGGPNNSHSFGLDPGTYWVRVTTPSGVPLGTSDSADPHRRQRRPPHHLPEPVGQPEEGQRRLAGLRRLAERRIQGVGEHVLARSYNSRARPTTSASTTRTSSSSRAARRTSSSATPSARPSP